MEPSILGIIAASSCIVLCAIAAVYSIKTCGTALASVTSEKPELGGKLSITIILGEALAIYGLLISFMIIAKVPELQTEHEAVQLLLAAFTMAGTAFTASLGIAYCGPALMTAVITKPESFTINIMGLILSEALAIYGLLISFMIIG